MVKRIFILIGLFILQVLIVKLLGGWSYFTNFIYPFFYEKYAAFSSYIWGWVPFSVGDVFYLFLGGYLVYLLLRSIVHLFRKRTFHTYRNLAKIGFWVNLLYFAFHVFWGFNYYRPSLLEINKVESIELEELKSLAQRELQISIKLREKCKEQPNGVLSYSTKEFILPESLPKSDQKLKMPYKYAYIHPNKKKSIFSPMFRYFGISGYFNPFSAEAQYIAGVPTTSLPFTLAHEQAHQMGYAAEYEANFVGYLWSVHSDSPEQQYSAHYKALKYLLNAIYVQDTVFVKQIFDQFSQGMKNDYQAEVAFRQKHQGRAEEYFSAMNDLYLKSNQQQGVVSYSRFVELLVAEDRANRRVNRY